jgi:hypothetical protein
MFDTLLARVDILTLERVFFPPYGQARSETDGREVSVTDETSEPRIWTEINNLIAAITH